MEKANGLVGHSDVILMIPGRFERGENKTGYSSYLKEHTILRNLNRELEGDSDAQAYLRTIEYSMNEELRFDAIYKEIETKEKLDLASCILVNKETLEEMSIEECQPFFDAKELKEPILIRQYDRRYLGDVRLTFLADTTMERKDTVTFDAMLFTVRHSQTRFGVFEIYIKNCGDVVHILEAYRHGRLRLTYDDLIEKTEYNFLKALSFDPCGSKRSIVFAYGDVADEMERGEDPDQILINILANEESPKDGRVAGIFREKIKNENRSQYEDFKTFVSRATLLEVTEEYEPDFETRVDYQTSEMFFLEMLLLQDASTDNIRDKIIKIEDGLKTKRISGSEAAKRLERLHIHLSTAVQFSGVRPYIWPTVQESVLMASKDFGLDSIMERYKENENLLEDMIDAVTRAEKNTANSMKEIFLLIIAALSWIKAVSEAVDYLKAGSITYIISVSIVTIACIFVFFSQKYHRRIIDKIKK